MLCSPPLAWAGRQQTCAPGGRAMLPSWRVDLVCLPVWVKLAHTTQPSVLPKKGSTVTWRKYRDLAKATGSWQDRRYPIQRAQHRCDHTGYNDHAQSELDILILLPPAGAAVRYHFLSRDGVRTHGRVLCTHPLKSSTGNQLLALS